MFPGFGTALNVATVLVGSGIGIAVGHRLPLRVRDTVTDALGLVTLLIAGLSASSVTDPVLRDAVGDEAPVLIVLGAVVVGGIIGSLVGWRDASRRWVGGSATGWPAQVLRGNASASSKDS